MPASSAGTPQGSRGALAAAALLAVVLVGALADLTADLRAGTTWLHVVFEGSIAVAGAAGLLLMLRRLQDARRREDRARIEADVLHAQLAKTAREAERWREEAGDLLAGLGAAIQRQLARWELSAAETAVATFLLKGFSHKQIAGLRDVSEATVRQQARSVYKKAGVEGRHDLAAFFLADLVVPPRACDRSSDAAPPDPARCGSRLCGDT